jgi:hypothetical protein
MSQLVVHKVLGDDEVIAEVIHVSSFSARLAARARFSMAVIAEAAAGPAGGSDRLPCQDSLPRLERNPSAPPYCRARDERAECERWKSFTHDELIARHTVNLDITWLQDESREDADNLPAPEVIAREIVEDLTAALAELEAVAAALEAKADEPEPDSPRG